MSKRNLEVFGRKLLVHSPKILTVKFNNKLRIKVFTKNKTQNAVQRRNYSTCKDYNRHCYDEQVEKLVNEQINTEFNAGYEYLGMANYFGRSNVALPGCYGYFMKMFYEENDHAMGFIKYQNLRGGIIKLVDIKAVKQYDYSNVVETFKRALEMEKTVKEKLQQLFRVANEVEDTNVLDFLDPYISHQEHSISEISRLFTRVELLSESNVGKYLFDRELHETHVQKSPGKCTAEVGNKLYT